MLGASPTLAIIRSRATRCRSICLMPAPTALREAARARVASLPSGTRKVTEPAAAFCARVEQVVALAAQQRVPHRQADAVLEADVGAYDVGEPVDPRRPVGVGAAESGEAQRGPLDAHGGVALGEVDDRLADLARERACAAYVGAVDAELAGGLRAAIRASARRGARTPASARSRSIA